MPRIDVIYTWWSRRHAKVAVQRPGETVDYHKHFGAGGYDISWEHESDNVWKPGDENERPSAWIKMTANRR